MAAIATAKGPAAILNVETGDTVRRLEGTEEELGPKAFSPDGKLVVFASTHGADVFDVQTGQRKRELRCR